MTSIYFSFHLKYFNTLMLTNPSNKLSLSWNYFNYSLYMYLFLGFLSKSTWWYIILPSLSDAYWPSSCLCKGPMGCSSWYNALLCLTENPQWYRRMRRIYFLNFLLLGCHPLGGIYFPLSVWGKLGFWPFKMWLLGKNPADAASYWVIISGVHDLGVGNVMWYFVGIWRGIPGG